MAVEKREVEYSKEVDDVMVAVIELVKDIKAKKDLSALAAENLQGLIQAVAGAEQIPAEAQNKVVFAQTIGYRAGELSAAFLG